MCSVDGTGTESSEVAAAKGSAVLGGDTLLNDNDLACSSDGNKDVSKDPEWKDCIDPAAKKLCLEKLNEEIKKKAIDCKKKRKNRFGPGKLVSCRRKSDKDMPRELFS